ncbi:ABC transporter permease [Spongiactinospora rosea]|uniref:ABC transporter permease n=1 Tax=Spongiactinospora rosea TaxID=2248750 RepID=A0A366LM81_9ACTN|nr:ABC transporter permease [Spongiactinospora rosea]RBQ14272.1 ABC transporter permease [Spongiactinospora rosea]
MTMLVWAELRALARNVTFLLVTIGLPVVFFLVMSEVFGDMDIRGIDMSRYMMLSMAAFGAMSVSIAVGTRVGRERLAGWNRQLRLTPLPGWSYVVSKVIVALALVLPTTLLIFLAGLALKGVSLTAGQWLGATLAVWLGALPFGVIGLAIGLSVRPDSADGLGVAVYLPLAMLGGLWVPVEILPGFMATFAKVLPSYWLAENARQHLISGSPGLAGPLVVLTWFLALAAVVATLYRRDTSRL